MSVSGKYQITMNTPMGAQTSSLVLKEDGNKLSGSMTTPMGSSEFDNGTVDGNSVSFEMKIAAMGQEFTLNCKAAIDGDNISGQMQTPMGGADFSGKREA